MLRKPALWWPGAIAAAVAAALAMSASAALAHASGTVPQARLSADGERMLVHWWAAGDDVADIGVGLGLLPEEASLAFLGVGDAFPSEAEVTRFARSEELRTYLLDNLQVTQDGVHCDPSLSVPDQVIAEGVRYEFTCPQQVEQVAVRITLLHDRDELYRTYSIDGTIWTEMHTVRDPEHVWDASLIPTAEKADGLPLLLAGLGFMAAGGGAALWWWARPTAVGRSRSR